MAIDDLSVANGLLRTVYTDTLDNPIPDDLADVMDLLPFSKSDQIGSKLSAAVILKLETGFKRASGTAGKFALPTPSGTVVKDLEVDATQIAGATEISWDLIAKALRSNSKQAVKSALSTVTDSLMQGMNRDVLLHSLYGGPVAGDTTSSYGNWGVIASGTASATQTITKASFAPAIFYGSEGRSVDVYSPDLVTNRGNTTISTYNIDNLAAPTITLSGSITTTTGDVILPAGIVDTAVSVETAGLEVMLGANAASYFGQLRTTYPLLVTPRFNVAGALTKAKLGQALALLKNRGAVGKKTALINTWTFQNLTEEMDDLVRFTQGQVKGKSESGFNAMTIWTPAGAVEVIPSEWIKQGSAFVISDSAKLRRIGAMDVKLGGPLNEDIIQRIPGYAGYSLCSYYFGTPFTSMPSHCLYLYGIVNA